MTRIVGGLAAGRRLAVPAGRRTRPTSDRAREALFSTLVADRGGLAGARVIDLFAGSGAFGLEALSRGAAAAVLVDSDPRAVVALRANVVTVGLPGASVIASGVERLPPRPPGGAFEVCFADPPYACAGLAGLLGRLAAGGWFAVGATVVVERASRDAPFRWPAGLSAVKHLRYGDATLWYATFGTVAAGRAEEGTPDCPDERSARGPSTR